MHLTNWLSCASRAKLHLKQHLFRVPIFNLILSIFISVLKLQKSRLQVLPRRYPIDRHRWDL